MTANTYFVTMARSGADNHFLSYKDLTMEMNSDDPMDNFPEDCTKGRISKYFDKNTCRESVMYRLHKRFEYVLSEKDNRHGLIGIRCFGSVHSYVAQYLMEDKSRIAVLEKFFQNWLSYKIRVRVDKYTGKGNNNKFPISTNYMFTDRNGHQEIFDKSYYTTIYLRSWDTPWKENEPQLTRSHISAVIEVLRERSIVEKICNHEINNAYELALEYFRLGILRSEKSDLSFPMLENTIISGSNSVEHAVKSLGDWLATSFNGEGADHLSMIVTGFYVVYANIMTPRFDKGTGPVGSMTHLPTDVSEPVVKHVIEYFRNDKNSLEIIRDALMLINNYGNRMSYHFGLNAMVSILRKTDWGKLFKNSEHQPESA